jgi:putative phosphoribosyl transferase
MTAPYSSELVLIASGRARLPGVLELPQSPRGIVLFAHGCSSSRLSPRNNYVAGQLRRAGLGTLLLDLLSRDEDSHQENRFDIELLGARLSDAQHWLAEESETKELALGLFGASTGAAAALQLAADGPDAIGAVVSRGGRPDLAGAEALAQVRAPTLLIVGGQDDTVIELNRQALPKLTCEKELAVIRGATNSFEEPGALTQVARLAARWFRGYLGAGPQSAA